MPSQDKPKIVFKSIEHELTQVRFTKLESHSESHQVNIEHVLNAKAIDEDGFVITAQRSLSFNPKGAFEIFIEFNIQCQFNEESKTYYHGNLDEISKFIEKRKIEIFNRSEVGNLMSVLISQIALAHNYRSIVVPPYIENIASKQR